MDLGKSEQEAIEFFGTCDADGNGLGMLWPEKSTQLATEVNAS
jgi:hypothetical protein